MADVQTQIDLEERYAKNHLVKRIKKELIANGFVEFLNEKDIPELFGIDLITQMILHKRAKVNVLIGLLWFHFRNQENQGTNPFQACADMLKKAVEADVVDFSHIDDRFILKYDLPRAIQKEIDMYQFPLPMVVHPKKVTNNRETGYYTIRESVILKNNHHDEDVVLEHLNKCNSVKLCLNIDTVRLVQNQWRNLDKLKPGETVKDWQKRVKAFEKYDASSREVIESLYIMGNEFWLTHRYDKRGRTYAVGYHVNTQGNDWNKAVVEFADKEELR